MSETKKSILESLLIPLAVGLILAISTFLIPKILEVGLSYTVEKPTNYLSQRLHEVTIQVNGVTTNELFVTKVRLWNSGSVGLKDLPVLFYFNTQDPNFKILNFAHATTPEREFGPITPSNPDNQSVRFVYTLLNRGEEDNISFLTNEDVEPSVYAKAEDLRLKQVTPNRSFWQVAPLLTASIGIIASSMSTFLVFLNRRRMERLRAQVIMAGLQQVGAALADVGDKVTEVAQKKVEDGNGS